MYAPIALNPARAWRSYCGGKLIGEIHGWTEPDGHYPEEWLMSVVEARNPAEVSTPGEGLSLRMDGEGTLKESIERDPEGMLGAGKTSPGVLMKILDAAQRLSVQVHPTRQDAQRLFHSPYGKTECWHVLGGREIDGEKPYIYFGFRPGVTREIWAELFRRQDIPGMLACLHKISVLPGQTYFIRGGVPHAIGPGCLLAEIQEPTDLTLRTERVSPSGEPLPDLSCHQGIGFERMLDCFDYGGLSLEATLETWRVPPKTVWKDENCEIVSLLDARHTSMFRLEKLRVFDQIKITPGGNFHGIYVLSGCGQCICHDKIEEIGPGSQYFVPAACDDYALCAKSGSMTVLRWYGPEK